MICSKTSGLKLQTLNQINIIFVLSHFVYYFVHIFHLKWQNFVIQNFRFLTKFHEKGRFLQPFFFPPSSNHRILKLLLWRATLKLKFLQLSASTTHPEQSYGHLKKLGKNYKIFILKFFDFGFTEIVGCLQTMISILICMSR